MGRLKVRYLRAKNGRKGEFVGWFWEPTPAMRAAGFRPEALGKEPGPAIARAESLNAEWDSARKGEDAPAGPQSGTVTWLIGKYKASDWFTGLADATRDEGERHLAVIAAAPLGKADVRQIRRKHCRVFHEKRSAKKGRDNANRSLKWLRRLLSYAVELDLIAVNPAKGMAVKGSKPRRQRWTVEQIEAFKATARQEGRASWALAVQLGYDTSQRLSDLLRATWTAYDGEGLTIRQGKTDAEVWCDLGPESRRMLAETPRRSTQIIVGDVEGRPIGKNYFAHVFADLRAKAGLPAELQFRDLRRTAISEAFNAGADPTPLSGHMPGSTAIRVYAVPDRDASRRVQAARRANQEQESAKSWKRGRRKVGNKTPRHAK